MGGAGGEGGRDPVAEDVCGGASPSAGRKRRSEGCFGREAGETMAASWTVGVLASMAGGRGGGGGRTVALVPPLLRHGARRVKVAVGDF